MNWKIAKRAPGLRRQFRQKMGGITNSLWRFWAWIGPAWPAAAVVVLLLVILIPLWSSYSDFSELIRGIYVAAWGTFFDVLIAGFVLVLFAVWRRRRESIERYIEEIEDFKKWDNEEARLRIAGNVRRLAKLGKTDIDFSGITLKNFKFVSHDIESLRGAIFSLGPRLDKMSKNSTLLENVDFSFVDCTNVVFSKSFFKSSVMGLVGTNLAFTDAKLSGACFEGAKLTWTDYKANKSEWYVDHGEDDDGNPINEQAYYPAFSGADLKGCSFKYVELDHADFRDADSILEADFSGAEGLDTCFFEDDVRDRILASAKKRPSKEE